MKPGCSIAFALIFFSQILHGQLSETAEDITSVLPGDRGVELTLSNARVSVTAYTPTIVRVRCARNAFAKDFSYAVIKSPEAFKVTTTESAGEVRIATDSLEVVIAKHPFRVRFLNRLGKILNEDDPHLGIAWQGTEVTCYKKLVPDERFIGLGEKVGSLDRRGASFVDWNTDHYAYSAKDDPLYASTPFFIGLHGGSVYGIFFDNTCRSKFDFGASSDNTTSSFSAVDGEMNYYFIGGSTVAGILASYTGLTGRMNLPPLWSLGYQQCRWSYYPDTEVLSLARTFRERRVPADVIYLDIHYMDDYKIFTWHPERFSRPKAMLDTLRGMGFHVVTIVDPGIKIDTGYVAHDEGVAHDYFIKYPDGRKYIGSVWPGRCYFPDFTSEPVRKWWGASFARLIEPGVEGFWNDMNEPAVWGQSMPDLVEVSYDGAHATMRQAHNIYGMQMARSTYEGSKALLGGQRPFVLTRAGYSGVQRFSAIWTGDNVPTDEHMMLGVRLVNSMGLAGMPFAGPDVGGFSGDATPELFTRWMSIGAYTPFFRNHKQNGMRRQEPWSLGEHVEELTRSSIEERYRLLPYIYSTFYESTQNGMPVARSLAIDYSFDEHIYWQQFQQEYLFGKNILVAPVTSKEELCEVYLPEGAWYRSADDQLYEGRRTVIVKAPLDNLPVFVRAGAIIPKQSLVQYTAAQPSDTLELHLYFGKGSTSFVYYEDDGTTFEYENAKYFKRAMAFDGAKKEIVLAPAEGTYATRFNFTRLHLHGFPDIRRVTINGAAVQLSTAAAGGHTLDGVVRNIREKMVVKW